MDLLNIKYVAPPSHLTFTAFQFLMLRLNFTLIVRDFLLKYERFRYHITWSRGTKRKYLSYTSITNWTVFFELLIITLLGHWIHKTGKMFNNKLTWQKFNYFLTTSCVGEDTGCGFLDSCMPWVHINISSLPKDGSLRSSGLLRFQFTYVSCDQVQGFPSNATLFQ
jgi:hypothetical protein